MYIVEDNLDDLLRGVFSYLIKIEPTYEARRGKFSELFGVVLHLKNPLARFSRSEMKGKLFSAIGETLWYLSGENKIDFIDYYVPNVYKDETKDGLTVRSGYGERLFNYNGNNQVETVITLLKSWKSSRRAVVQLFDASDLSHDSIPCTCTWQFLIRDNKLNMFVNMRSNDAYLGLPHDVFAFTMFQEIVAKSVGVEMGEYKHAVGSLHLYSRHYEGARLYLSEAWQSKIAMPRMPEGDPWVSIARILEYEKLLRTDASVDFDIGSLQDYWRQICLLLQAYRHYRNENLSELIAVRKKMGNCPYIIFVDSKVDALSAKRT